MKTCLSRLLLSLLLLLLSGVSAFALENRVSEKILCAETVPEENTVLQPLPRLENNCFLTKGLSDTRYQFAGNMANNLLSNQNNQEHARSTTQAAVSEGALIIRNQDQQQQNLAELRRDVEQANPRLSAIFDKEKEQQRLKTAQLIGEIGNQASDIARTEGAIAAEKAQRNPQARETAKAALVAKGNQSPTERQITEQARHTAMADYGTGSPLQQGMQAATAAIQGLAGGDLKSAIAGGSAPYLAEVIKKSTPDENSRVMAHAVVAGALAQMQGNNPVAGAAGAATGEIAASVIKAQLYPDKNVSALSESEKQTVSTLSTLASGLAGGIAGDSTASAVAGAQAGKTVVENNFLLLATGTAESAVVAGAAGDASKDVKKGAALALDKAAAEVKKAACLGNIICLAKIIVNGEGENTSWNANEGSDPSKSEQENTQKQNIAQALTDEEKAELGGAGSGTPGGWEPQDEENARNNEAGQQPTTNEQIGKWSVDELSDGAKHIDPASKKGDLTLAGRALQKHGSREGSAFPSAKGNPSAVNEQGQKIVNSILNDPKKKVIQSNTGRYGQVTDIISSNGRGLRYDAQGKLIGFLEPPK